MDAIAWYPGKSIRKRFFWLSPFAVMSYDCVQNDGEIEDKVGFSVSCLVVFSSWEVCPSMFRLYRCGIY